MRNRAFFRLLAFIYILSFHSVHTLMAQDMVKSVSNEGLSKVVSFNVASFTDVRDKRLGDVMAKMPGMNSTASSYNGMSVAKVFINGIDMLNGDYSIVSEMKPEDVESIEITENYVYEKVLSGLEYSNSVSLNIILKEGAKSEWRGSVKGGLGFSPLLHNVEGSAINIGQKAQTTITLKSDNTGLDYSGAEGGYFYGRVNSFLSVNPALAPLSSQRTRINSSSFGNITTTVPLKKDLQLSLKLIAHSDRLTASSYDETEYFQTEGGSIFNVSGKESLKKQKDYSATMTLLSNSEKNYFKNETLVVISDHYGHTDISGTYPSDQSVNLSPLLVRNDFSYIKPVGDRSIFTVNFNLYYDSKPQCLQVERQPFNLRQDIDTHAYTEELEGSYKIKAGKFSVSFIGTVNTKLWYLDTQLNPSVPEVQEAAGVDRLDNDSRFSYYKLAGNVSATYIDDKLQLAVTTPLNYYRNFFDNYLSGDSSYADRWHFQPSVSGKYQFSDNLSASIHVTGRNDGLVGSNLYYGLVMTDFQSFSQGNINSQNDKSAVTNAAITYRYPKKSFFANATYYRLNMNQELKYASKFTDNFNISGYIPVDIFKSLTDQVTIDLSKGITSFKGKVGVSASYNNYRTTIDRNNTRLPYTSKTYTLTGNINGKVLQWMNMVYSASFNHSNLTMTSGSETLMASSSNGLTQSLEFIFLPWDKFNFSFLGDHYMNQIAQNKYKNVIIADFKAEYTINPRWQLIASVTNLLDQRTYDYILISSMDASSSYTSYTIRPRNLLLSAFFKF